jgi:2-iminobutanoate/2-iminopropanoate deaminase
MQDRTFHMLAGVPAPISPSSHAVEVDGWVFLTGQFGRDLDRPDLPLPEGIEAQTERTLGNMRRVLGQLGLGLEHLVSVRVFLTHFHEDYDAMNRVYARFFPTAARPTRTCVGVTGMVRGAVIEIDGIARRPRP